MCGIAGFAGWPLGDEEAARTVRTMCDAIVHRGPDDSGYFVAPEVALGMRRLSIIDVGGGQQPIGNEDGSIQVVFNGEIYNHHDLRHALVAGGHRFRTRSDTETIVHLYEDVGTDFVTRLRGMFAIALWDARTKRLVLARDRVGIKPLSYWLAPDGIAFCSELRSLLALSRFPRRLDERGIAAFLSLGYVPDPLAAFAGVTKLPPGHVLTWSADRGAAVRRYWTPIGVASNSVDEAAAQQRVRDLLADAVGSHLEAEVPLGAFLSGGLDSSTVVALMARAAPIRPRTFAIGFDEAAFNEAPHARRVAEAIGTRHTDLVMRPDADRWVEGVVSIFDEPFADSSALPTYLVSWLARQQVTVSLSGDGGDELFGGYTRYLDALRRPTVPAWGRSLLRTVGHALPHIAPGRGRLLDRARSREAAYAGSVGLPLPPIDGGIAAARLVPRDGEFDDVLADAFKAAGARDFVSQMMLVDVATYLPGDILTKVDRASMAVSLEARVPLLDHALVEFALGLPADWKIRDGTGKRIFRRAIRGLVPSEVLEHPKLGFAVPLGPWFRGPLRHRIDRLAIADGGLYDFLDRPAVRRLVREHLMRRRDHSTALWRALVLHLWLAHLDAGRLARPVPKSLIEF
ncbi:MAG: asparagine synthase (glutamine-hydrolyzing) [Actinobacteria bacterium 13_2_20CM_2_66_6]|nr:MAG: asparagine synthase (glutamine-hydrolyzing) [Actinobacteria bacterium 13_2_20CM_2_66_6]